ncbi:MAG: type II toxin-antitoxin system HicB family antitoxin [Rhodospirillales bacterium]|jgi:predicted RNase H-like HicB family nuclease|nr:type II toxin-antitoxin system HicB family antitoxin [Rhodospirillales bacterium]MDP6646585.1 type II toxin-antitoxin system HicB family antitoxin [Rhodospirillales bacterium]MDP6843000.1 type II toxin-antitoxin system HicB family antitoxin [Rhodospirillales bacterium]|tara:strand:+ start:2512 stop:2940 length:429 start_codon:yes stop_codon:yes gene_type:complete
MTRYIGLLWKDEKHDVTVTVPDFPGFLTGGKSLEEATNNADKGLSFHMENMIKVGENIPDPTAMEDILADPEIEGSIVFMVNAADPREKSVRVNLTLPEFVVRLIDGEAASRRKTRSAFIKDLALRELTISDEKPVSEGENR